MGALAALACLSCQTYDFEPVQPLAIAQTTIGGTVVTRKAKPNIMLVVDKSGSMNDKIDPGCSSGSCPTRLSEMKQAMDTFLSKYGDTGRLGLAVFPNATQLDACVKGQVVTDIVQSADVDAELKAAASSINDTIQSIGSGGLPAVGGTPTAATLAEIGKLASLQSPDRDDFVLLLTDGLPNCNASLDRKTCQCVTGQTPCDDNRNCLDQMQVVNTIDSLRQKGIRVIVVGFGADTGASIALPVLNAMAEHGGFARKCETAADCGGTDTCDQVGTEKYCSTRFFQAANAQELATKLSEIGALLPGVDPCVYELESKPEDPRLLAVYVGLDGAEPTKVEPGPDTWTFVETGNAGSVTFTGDICQNLRNASDLHPVNVEIRLVQPL
ncbi:MAG: adventurous gliding motility lipoprotein CglB [Myxococcaceae bacterium]|nr:adventurous gliding motility lipoprotein CglB [Myxococcaceae bacterium]